jgi:hypothetical protein
MGQRSAELFACLLILGLGVIPSGCGNGHRVICSASADSSSCNCGSCPAQVIPQLYATTTSNQILGFSIGTSGALTPLSPVSGPANSESITGIDSALMFADSSTNQVFSETVDFVSGVLTPVSGSPFTLGTVAGGPTSIMIGPYANFYATEPNGTIVGYSTPGEGMLTAPLPGSPYTAGTTPAQMASAALTSSSSAAFSLYASDPGDANGGILAFSLASDGYLSPIAGSPFSTSPDSGPSFLLNGSGGGSGQFLFVSLSNAGEVAVFMIDDTTGALTPVPGSPFTVGNGPNTLIEDSANHLFVMNTVDHTVAAFSVAANGVLTPIGSPVAVGTASGGMAFYPGNQLYTADTTASSIEIVNVDSTSGALSSAGSVAVSVPPLQLAYVFP